MNWQFLGAKLLSKITIAIWLMLVGFVMELIKLYVIGVK